MYGSSPSAMTGEYDSCHCHVKFIISFLICHCLFPCLANGSDSKKQRLDDSPPSRVLHIRKLPNEVSETEVIALGLPFGKVTNILMLKGKNQVQNFEATLQSVLP